MSERSNAVLSFTIPLDTVARVQERLLRTQTALAMALGTLGKVTTYGEEIVLDGVSDIFAALKTMLTDPCAEPISGVNTTGVFSVTEHGHVAGDSIDRSGQPGGFNAGGSGFCDVRGQQTGAGAS